VIVFATVWERVVILAPAIVISIALVAAVLMLLGRAFVENVRDSGHQRLIYAGLVVLAVFIGVMTYIGVELPSEGGH
jgi:hypothetical protein